MTGSSEVKKWKELAAGVLKEAASRKTEVEVRFHSADQLTVTVRKKKLEEIRQSTPLAASMRVFEGKRCCSGSTSRLDAQSLLRLLDRLSGLVRLVDEDEANGLPEPELLFSGSLDLDLYDPKLEELDSDRAREMALECERAALAAHPLVTNSQGASVRVNLATTLLCNSRGVEAWSRSSMISIQANPVAEDGKGNKFADYWWSSARHLADLDDPTSVGEKAGLRAAAQVGATKVATGRFPVLFAPEPAAALLELLFQSISGTAVYKGSTFLAGKEGQAIASPLVTVIDDPLRRRGLGSAAFDAEGVRTSRVVLVDKGILKLYPCDCFSARRLNRTSTGHSSGGGVTSYNLFIANGDKTPQELLSIMGTGLFVTSFIGFAFNQATGDFSRGVRGFWVENGRKVHPAQEITVSSNLGTMLQEIIAVGNDLSFRSATNSPSLLLHEMTVSGT